MEAVSRGRLAEHEEFFAARGVGATGSSEGFADPAEAGTFEACRLDWSEPAGSQNAQLLALHRALLEIRRTHSSLGNCRRDLTRAVVDETGRTLTLVRSDPGGETTTCLFNLSDAPRDLSEALGPQGHRRLFSTCDARFGGDPTQLPPERVGSSRASQGRVSLAAWSAAIYISQEPS